MKKITLIILLTLVVNLIGHNLHSYFGAKLFYYCEYINYAIFYLLLYQVLKGFWVRFLCGVGVIFSINDIVDLRYNPYETQWHEWALCLSASIVWYFYLKKGDITR